MDFGAREYFTRSVAFVCRDAIGWHRRMLQNLPHARTSNPSSRRQQQTRIDSTLAAAIHNPDNALIGTGDLEVDAPQAEVDEQLPETELDQHGCGADVVLPMRASDLDMERVQLTQADVPGAADLDDDRWRPATGDPEATDTAGPLLAPDSEAPTPSLHSPDMSVECLPSVDSTAPQPQRTLDCLGTMDPNVAVFSGCSAAALAPTLALDTAAPSPVPTDSDDDLDDRQPADDLAAEVCSLPGLLSAHDFHEAVPIDGVTVSYDAWDCTAMAIRIQRAWRHAVARRIIAAAIAIDQRRADKRRRSCDSRGRGKRARMQSA